MKNLTDYNNDYLLDIIRGLGGNPHKCTVSVQYAVVGNSLIPVLSIYEDLSKDWDIDDVIIFCERTEAVDFCDKNKMTFEDLFSRNRYYEKESFQKMVNDIEFEIEDQEYWKAVWKDWHISKTLE